MVFIAMGTSRNYLECDRVIIQAMQSGAWIFAQEKGFHSMKKVITKVGVFTFKTLLLESDDIYLTRKKEQHGS